METNIIIILRNVIFHENMFPCKMVNNSSERQYSKPRRCWNGKISKCPSCRRSDKEPVAVNVHPNAQCGQLNEAITYAHSPPSTLEKRETNKVLVHNDTNVNGSHLRRRSNKVRRVPPYLKDCVWASQYFDFPTTACRRPVIR